MNEEPMTEATSTTQGSVVQAAVAKVIALRTLTRQSGCITTRTQSKILCALTPDELVEAAEILAKQSGVSDVKA
jgi:hypothetical protein